LQYGGHSLQGEDNGKKYSKISLNVGLTDYRTFVGTNLNPSWANFLFPSDDNAERCQHMASPLGNGAIVETSDDMILVLQRSENVGEFPGYFVFPGGHPEPNEVGILSHQCDTDVDSGMINKKISDEMFDSIIREVVEEIGVPAESLSDPIFIGISQREVNVRPAAFFYIKCNLSPEAIHHFYSDAQDGYESTKLLALPKINAYGWTSRMPGCHQGGYALYEAMLTVKYDV
uniref:Nudix hydrolase domain-containing protein n=1 Tax=Kalanchoe fedtschenkoi TaxID=63787 RepID=A0A7N0U9T3_KALFE